MTALIAADALTKYYGARAAVENLSFSAARGQICGVLGPNGAGKSTTLRMLVGILPPSAGVVLFNGAPLNRAAQKRIGYLPEERGLYRSMTARAVITHLARLKGVKGNEARKRADALLEEHGLGAYRNKKLKTLSKGMAQKVQLLAAIAHKPDLIVFDEPFSGLDPVNQRTVEEIIRAIARDGGGVLFSTHVMEHAERICDRIVLIAQGEKAFEGRVDEALAALPRAALLETEGAFDLRAALAPAGIALEEEPAPDAQHRRWRLRMDGADLSRKALAACVQAGAPLTLFEPTRPSLHDAFVALVGDRAAPPS
ncbi:MAG: ATP-binding cassette domain-containing protein [Alphaproteobacteria bacterium]|nr:ATP-binding cassette domain-containing protein [Alphaproteobacteria bacterium]